MSDGPEVVMNDRGPTMFGVARWEPDRTYDAVFVGVPSDTGGFGSRTPAAAAGMLRGLSHHLPCQLRDDGTSSGWYDYQSQRTLLSGLKLADAGDYPWSRLKGSSQLDQLPGVYQALRESARLVVTIGGDHANAFWLAQSLRGEGLVWLDAHEDATRIDGPYPHCGNVMSYIERLPDLPLVAQYGMRGLVSGRREPASHRVLCGSPAEVGAAVAAKALRSVAVSIDVDVLDPSLMPAVGSPLAHGLTPDHLTAVLAAVRAAGASIGMLELVEFAPASEADGPAGLLLLDLMLRSMALCLDGRAAGGP